MKKWTFVEILFGVAIIAVIVLAGGVAVVGIGKNRGWFTDNGDKDPYTVGAEDAENAGTNGAKSDGSGTGGENADPDAIPPKKKSLHSMMSGSNPDDFIDEEDREYIDDIPEDAPEGDGSTSYTPREGDGLGLGPDGEPIPLTGEPADITGKVISVEGTPIPGAVIRAFNLTRLREQGFAMTDSAGAYVITAGQGEIICLKVEAEGYGSRKAGRVIAPGRKDFILDTGSSLELTVTDNGSPPEPITRYTVQLAMQELIANIVDATPADIAQHIALPQEMRHTISFTVESSDGKTVIPNMTPGSYSLVVRADGYAIDDRQGYWRAFRIKQGETHKKAVRLVADREVNGIVLDEETGDPVAGARVSIGLLEAPLVPPEELPETEVYSDEEGKFVLRGIPGVPGRITSLMIIVDHPDYMTKNLNVSKLLSSKWEEDGSYSVVKISSLCGGVQGRVTDSGGNAMADIAIVLLDETDGILYKHVERTDPSGFYSFKEIAVGRYRLCRLDDVVRGDFLVRWVDVKAGETATANLDNVGSTISGVATFKGEPLMGAFISLRGTNIAGEREEFETTSDHKGRYMITGIPEGEYRLRAQKKIVDWSAGRAFRTEIVIKEAGEFEQAINFNSTTLIVKVRDDKGNAPESPVDYDDFTVGDDNRVTIQRKDKQGKTLNTFRGRLRENGEVGFSSIPAGHYTVQVKFLGYEIEDSAVDVVDGKDTNKILGARRLTGTISGRLIDANTGDILTGAGGVVLVDPETSENLKYCPLDSDGKFLFFIPKAGSYDLQPYFPEFVPTDGRKRVEVEDEKAEIEVDIEMVTTKPPVVPEDDGETDRPAD